MCDSNKVSSRLNYFYFRFFSSKIGLKHHVTTKVSALESSDIDGSFQTLNICLWSVEKFLQHSEVETFSKELWCSLGGNFSVWVLLPQKLYFDDWGDCVWVTRNIFLKITTTYRLCLKASLNPQLLTEENGEVAQYFKKILRGQTWWDNNFSVLIIPLKEILTDAVLTNLSSSHSTTFRKRFNFKVL